MLLEASAKPDGALGQALATAIVVAADQTFKDVIGDAIRERDAIEAWIERAGSLDKALAQLSQIARRRRERNARDAGSRNSSRIR